MSSKGVIIMKIDIPDEMLEEIGFLEKESDKGKKLIVETVLLGDRGPVEVTGSKYPNGVLIYVEE